MKHLFTFFIAITLLVSCSKPDFHDADGNGIFLKDLNEKWLIVNYWATWCGPCIAEIPELNELSTEYSDRVNLLGVNFDHPPLDELPAQIRKMKIEFPVFTTEPAPLLGIEVPLVLPTTFVFAPGGKLVKTLTGPQTRQTILDAMETSG